jgi:hypothetical protein
MPMLIEHIDAIARKKQRDVLFIKFRLRRPPWGLLNADGDDENSATSPPESTEDNEPVAEGEDLRRTVCQWLTDQGIPWKPCAGFADENTLIGGDQGLIYLDLPFDDNDPQYQKVRDYLEYPDGHMRFASVTFCYLPLEMAMKNAHHDEPGFWERWAENF